MATSNPPAISTILTDVIVVATLGDVERMAHTSGMSFS
jgi:hypothetical protein